MLEGRGAVYEQYAVPCLHSLTVIYTACVVLHFILKLDHYGPLSPVAHDEMSMV